ncbi:MAG: hypothetical protein KFH87_07830 [Bacteroidetes bacterium]|nr:hypothetical protein [Bacteroidota bacterium]
MRGIRYIPLTMIIVFLSACTGDAPTLHNDGTVLYADAGYYPSLQGNVWEYRVDSIRGGVTQQGAATLRARTLGTFTNGDVEYRVQVNEITQGMETEYDTLYVYKTEEGVRLSSPGLQSLSELPDLPGITPGDIPRDFLVVPYATFQSTWDILDIEFNQIPLLTIYFRLKGRYLGVSEAVTDLRTFPVCARVQLIYEAQFPNPENPTDIFNPIRINETADFYYTRPQGLVLAEGSAAIFLLIRGGIPFERSYARVRQEITGMTITQPDPFCIDTPDTP